jgi:hypothetical protein
MYVQEIFLDESGEYAKQATKPFCISSKYIGPSGWVTACGCFLVPEESSKTWSQTKPADVSWFRKKFEDISTLMHTKGTHQSSSKV